MSAKLDINYATVEAFERSKTPEKQRRTTRFFTIVLLAVFFIVLMIGLAAGVIMYKHVAETQANTNSARMQSGLLTSSVKANDAAGAIGAGSGPEGRSLVLMEELDSGIYELRIYKWQGNIVEEYSVAGSPYTPARAQALMKSEVFDFTLAGNLLTIRTDEGAVDIDLRSWQGSA